MADSQWCQKTDVPPKDVQPQIRLSSLLEQGWHPLLITGFLVDMLRRHFATPLSIEFFDLRNYVWREDERSGILIESAYRWRGDLVHKRPAVLLRRNAQQNQEVLLHNLAGLDEQRFQYRDYTTHWVGSHTLFCIHGTDASVEILATEVQHELTRFSPVVREYLGLGKFSVTEVGAIAEIEESTENYAVPITVGWTYQESWRLREESLPLRRIPLSVLLDGIRFQ